MIYPQSGNIAPWLALLGNPNQTIDCHVNVMREGGVIADYPVESATIVLDRTQTIRRQCTLTMAPVGDQTLDPSWMDLFSAAGNEVRPWYRVTFTDGTQDEVCLGTFPIVETTWEDSGPDVVTTVKGQDRMFLLNESEQLVPYTIASTTIDQAISELVNSQNWGMPIPTNIVPTSAMVPTTGAVVKAGKTMASQITELAAVAGYEAFMDEFGTLVARPIPTPSDQAPVVQISTLISSGMKTAKMTSTRQKIYSAFGVVASGTTTAVSPTTGKVSAKKAAIYAEADDTNPASPTYFAGAFGKISKLTRSGLATDSATAQAMADGLLAQ